jgi:hypothetical protein
MFNLKCAIFQIFLTRASLQTIYNVGKIVTVRGACVRMCFFYHQQVVTHQELLKRVFYVQGVP